MSQLPSGKGRKLALAAGAAAVLIAAGIAVFYCLPRESEDRPPSAEPPPPSSGEISTQVHAFCGKCHAYPPPDSFPRSAWRKEVEQGYHFFKEANLLSMPAPPFEEVVKYYEDRAPAELPLVKPARASTPLPVKFTRTNYPVPPQASPPAISNVNLVHLFDKERLDVLACDMRHGLVMVLRPYLRSPKWIILGQVPHPAHAEVVDLDGDGNLDILVANLGSYEPTDSLGGSVVWLRNTGAGRFIPITLWKDVGRVADVQARDFHGKGKKDLVVGVFGWRNTGEILYLENQTTDWSHPKFKRHVLDERHGTIHVPVGDINGDGRPDIVALISQEHETIVAFVNDGKGWFEKKTIYTAPHPAYGSSGIQLVDFDGDGRLDVLYTNGDILDKPYLLKPYHGVQWLRNRGRFPFEHHPITPLHGVHRAVAADLTGKGKTALPALAASTAGLLGSPLGRGPLLAASDLLPGRIGQKDIVAVSFLPVEYFPQRKDLRLDSIVLLEQTMPGLFKRHALETGTCDHVTCIAGDIFHTGRTDLVVGQFCSTKCDYAITIWKNEGPAGGRSSSPRP